jgi:hypothetical protein
MFPQPGSTATSPTITGSTVAGAPYPFVYIPTTFPNQAACSSAYSGCVQQFSSCTAALGSVNGVTVGGGVGGFGTTVSAIVPTGNAQSICSSLSRQACYGLQIGICTAFGTGGATGTNTLVNAGGAAATRSLGGIYEMLTGLAIAIAGMIT